MIARLFQRGLFVGAFLWVAKTSQLTRALRPQNIHATIYKCLGIDPALKLLDHQGRPTPVLEDPSPIAELV